MSEHQNDRQERDDIDRSEHGHSIPSIEGVGTGLEPVEGVDVYCEQRTVRVDEVRVEDLQAGSSSNSARSVTQSSVCFAAVCSLRLRNIGWSGVRQLDEVVSLADGLDLHYVTSGHQLLVEHRLEVEGG